VVGVVVVVVGVGEEKEFGQQDSFPIISIIRRTHPGFVYIATSLQHHPLSFNFCHTFFNLPLTPTLLPFSCEGSSWTDGAMFGG
jgi:hypothetical protein